MSQRPFFSKDTETFVRTEELCKKIDENFTFVSNKEIKSSYLETGASEHGFVINNISSNSKDMLKARIAKSSSSLPIIQCDIGSGDFSYNKANDNEFKDQVVTYGITAKDFRSKHQRAQTPSTYIIGKNAEYFSKVFKDVQFDFLFSHATFMHFVDPTGSLIEAYKTLKPGGIMYIDQFSIPGCQNYAKDLIEYLERQGYHVVGVENNGKIKNFIIQKTDDKPELLMPFIFTHIGLDPDVSTKISKPRCAYYRPNEAFIAQQMLTKSNNEFYQKSREIIQKETAQYDYILQACPNIPSLLNNSEYQELDNVTQYQLILRLVADNFDDFKHIEKLIDEGKRADDDMKSFEYAYQSSMSANNLSDFTTLFYLPSNPFFSKNTGAQQLRLIQFFAAHDLIIRVKSEMTKEKLTQMGIPYKEENHMMFYSNLLTYPEIAKEYKKIKDHTHK